MFKNNFYLTFFILFALSTIFMHSGHTHENYPADYSLGGSTYADVKGSIVIPGDPVGRKIHVHGIVYSWDDGDHAVGDYTLTLEVSAPEDGFVWDDNWWEEEFELKTPVTLTDDFNDGIRVEADITLEAQKLSDIRAVEYKASATVRNQVGIASKFIKKPVHEFNEDEEIEGNFIEPENNNSITATLVSSDLIYTATAGNGHEANLTISEAYSYVFWYVKSPSETGLGTQIKTDYGDGGITTAQLDYSFPSGVSGDYVITASYILYSTGLSFAESYTVSVSLPTSPATVPDRPGFFSLSAGSLAGSIYLLWGSSASDGGSAITDYEYQYQRATGFSTWGPWSSWMSAGTDFSEGITGLSSGT